MLRLSPLGHAILGPDQAHRRHVVFVLSTLYFYVVCAAIGWHSSSLGGMPPMYANVMGSCLIVSWLVFYSLIRSGWSKRLRDPGMTLPHALVGIGLNVQAYMLTGPTRGNVLLLLALSIVFMMFRLNPRQIIGVSASAIVAMGAAMLTLTLFDAQAYPARIEAVNFVLMISCLITMGLVAKSVSDIRLRLIARRRELREALDRVQALATHDVLTGLANRAHMQDTLEHEIERGARGGAAFCVALLDLDFFKIVNDMHGHRVGDEVLRQFAAQAVSQLRGIDLLARWGGEEFVLLLPQTRLDEALIGLDRLRQHIEAQRLVPTHPDLIVTFSCGVAQWSSGECADRLIERADQALYRAKAQGRNRCVAAGPVSLGTLHIVSTPVPGGA